VKKAIVTTVTSVKKDIKAKPKHCEYYIPTP